MGLDRLKTALAARACPRPMYCYAAEPGRERSATAKRIEMRVRSYPRLLGDSLRLAVAANHGARETVDALVVAAHEDLENRDLPRKDYPDDLLVGEGIPLP